MKQKGLEIHNKVPPSHHITSFSRNSGRSQANSMNLKAIEENWFGGKILPISLRVDPEYRPTGRYWRCESGSQAYMATKLWKNTFIRLLMIMLKIWL